MLSWNLKVSKCKMDRWRIICWKTKGISAAQTAARAERWLGVWSGSWDKAIHRRKRVGKLWSPKARSSAPLLADVCSRRVLGSLNLGWQVKPSWSASAVGFSAFLCSSYLTVWDTDNWGRNCSADKTGAGIFCGNCCNLMLTKQHLVVNRAPEWS